MQNFSLEVLFQIIGIGAASGLVYHENSIFLISDTSSFLYEYNIENKSVNKIKLSENSQENAIKKEKLDFEAITLKDNKLYIFGSGSTNKREVRFTYDLKTKESKEKDFSKVYKKIRKALSISEDDFNIEGVIFKDEKWYFFQRGNGGTAKNGIITYDKKTDNIEFSTIHLPKINAIEATFTDAILVENTIYFLAAVENTDSTYNDGEIYGSFIGSIAFDTLKLSSTQKITSKQKFEGLALYKQNYSTISFMLCEDNDTEVSHSRIYQLNLDK